MKIGDRVSVIDDDVRGTVTSVHGDWVVVKDEFGFTHRYDKKALVVYEVSLYDEVKTVPKKDSQKPNARKNLKPHPVLDLHFEKLVENPTDYDSVERLFIQKEKLIEKIEFCRKNRIRKLEIIHGIGDGVLQKMVHDYLSGQMNIEFEDHEFFYHQTGSVLITLK